MVNSCGDKTDGCVDGGRREPKSTAGASEEMSLEREEKLNGENHWFCTPVLKSQTENIPPKVNRRCDQ